MLPVVRGIEETTRQIAAYAMVTVAVTFALTLTGEVGRFYAVAVLVLGALFVGPGARAAPRRRRPQARDQVLRVVEHVPDAGVRRRCRRRPRPLPVAATARPATVAAAIALLVVVVDRDPGGAARADRHADDDERRARRAAPHADDRSSRRSTRARRRSARPRPTSRCPTLDGPTVTLVDLRGQPVVLMFFASWCHPCEEEFPVLEQFAARARRRLAGRRRQLPATSPSDSRDFVRRLGVTFPALLDDADGAGRASATACAASRRPSSSTRRGVVRGRGVRRDEPPRRRSDPRARRPRCVGRDHPARSDARRAAHSSQRK